MKITVKEYASKFQVSVQSVYQRINKGTLKCIEEDGKKFVVVDKKEVKGIEQPLEESSKLFTDKVLKGLLKQVENRDERIGYLEDENRKLQKEVKRLNKKLLQSVENEKQTLLNFIGEQKKLIAHKEDEFIEVVEASPKKKKKKKKKSKNN